MFDLNSIDNTDPTPQSEVITDPTNWADSLDKKVYSQRWCLGLGQKLGYALRLPELGQATTNFMELRDHDELEPNQQISHTPGLKPVAERAKAMVIKLFGVTNIGGYEYRNINGTKKLSDHALGLALDIMVYHKRALGDQIASWASQNRDSLKVKYIIWYNQFKSANTNWQWEPYINHGPRANQLTVTGRHEDHVHISFYPD